jgi:hypothetical protein
MKWGALMLAQLAGEVIARLKPSRSVQRSMERDGFSRASGD